MKFLNRHLEWMVFFSGLILLATMDPTITGTSFCFFDFIGISFCPGEGLGHSIAYFFSGNLKSSFQANFMGPIAVLVLSARIITIWKDLLTKEKLDLKEEVTNV